MNLPRIAVAHLYATGPYHPDGPHGLLHVGLLPLDGPASEVREWVLNPGRPYSTAVREAAQIPFAQAPKAPVWAAIREEIQAAFARFDALLILDRAGQPGPERQWLEQMILSGLPGRPPVCVPLDELTAFWLPADTLDDADDLLDQFLRPDEKWQKTLDFSDKAPRLPFVLHCMRRAVRRTLESLLRPHGTGGEYQPAFGLLDAVVRQIASAPPVELRAHRLLHKLAVHPSCCDEPAAPDGQATLALRPLRIPQVLAGPLQPAQVRKLLCDWVTAWRTRTPDPAGTDEPTGAPAPPTGAELAAVFKHLGGQRPDWKPRPAQEQYAAFVADALGGRGPYALEAGTGTGKTFGYLVPALEYLRKTSGGRVIVATSTKNLQDQILSGELPALLGPRNNRNLLYQGCIRPAILKGKSCYVCADALARTYEEATTSPDWRDALAWLYVAMRLRDTEGEVEGIAPQVSNRLGGALWRRLRATTADRACRHDNADDLPECTYPIHRRRAEGANLIITNHSKLALLPPKVRDQGGICIIDEADRFPDNFRSALSRRFDARDLYDDLIGTALAGTYDETTRRKAALLDRLDERLEPEYQMLWLRAHIGADPLAALRGTADDDSTDLSVALDQQLENQLAAALATADLWAQTAEALADTPLAADATAETDRYLDQGAALQADLRRWRAVRAVRQATRTARTPLEELAAGLRAVGAALLGFPTDGGLALPYPAGRPIRWQQGFEINYPVVGRRWYQLETPFLARLRGLLPLMEAAAAALAPLREQLLTALPPPPPPDDYGAAAPDAEQSEADKRDRRLREQAARLAGLALEAAHLLRQMLTEFPCRAQIHTVEVDAYTNDPLAWRLYRLPYDLAPHLYALPDADGLAPTRLPADPTVPLLDTFRTVVFTSATIYVENELTYFQRLLDLPVPFAASARIKSPFQYERAVVGALPHFLKSFDSGWSAAEKTGWRQAALQTLLPLLLALDGRTLVLFTSNEDMRLAAQWLARPLAAHDIELLTQNDASQWEIRRFRRVEQSVLLGVDRMWTGVDFAGSTLAHVVIWRAPLPTPGDPLIAHRKSWETRPVFEDGFYWPSVRLKLRQGFGRLIRRETDRGGFLMLDARLSANKKLHHLLDELEVPLTEYGSPEALYDGFVPDLLRLMQLGDDFQRRGWTTKRLVTSAT